MGKKLQTTPRSRVRQVLRQLWLRSRERAAALKRDNYTCQKCQRKQSKAKGKEFSVEVHHKNGVTNWESIIDMVFTHLLCRVEDLQTLCKECHQEEPEKKRDARKPLVVDRIPVRAYVSEGDKYFCFSLFEDGGYEKKEILNGK